MTRRHFEVRYGARTTTVPMTESQSLREDVRELREALSFFLSYPNTYEAKNKATEALRKTRPS